MAGKRPNMKVNVTADNSDFKKRMQESKTAVRDFERFSEDALSSLGEAFGVNARQVEQVTSAIKGLGVKMQESGSTGAQAFGKLLAGANGLALGLAGIGIGGVVAGFKALKDEAEAFKNTVQGANIELQTQAYISTYKQFVHDYNEEIGKASLSYFTDLSFYYMLPIVLVVENLKLFPGLILVHRGKWARQIKVD